MLPTRQAEHVTDIYSLANGLARYRENLMKRL
jgi:hypothetical protein